MRLRELAANGIQCPDYQARSESKRCRHYADQLCELELHPVCEEWLRINPSAVPRSGSSPEHAKAKRLLAGRPDYRLAVVTASYFTPGWQARIAAVIESQAAVPPMEAGPTEADTEPHRASEMDAAALVLSWKALRVSIHLATPFGSLWLVPEYTGKERPELTPEDALKVCKVVDAFPGSHIEEFLPPEKTHG